MIEDGRKENKGFEWEDGCAMRVTMSWREEEGEEYEAE